MKKNYWYLFTIIECPVCGITGKFKERKYTKKPKNEKDRYIFIQEYDNCGEFCY